MHLVKRVDESNALMADARRLAFQLVDRLAVPAFVLDEHCRVLVWNRPCERLTGIAARDVIGTREHWRAFYNEPRPCLADLVVQDRVEHSADLYTVRHKTTEGDGVFAENWCVMPRLGTRLYLAIDASPVHDGSGRLIGAIETLRDITEHKKAEAEVERLAAHDALTGLANRTSFTSHVDALDRQGVGYALILLDIDRFKEINDVVGHAIGDRILAKCAALFRQAFPKAYAARLGGDEFALVLAGESDRNRVAKLAADLLALAGDGVTFDETNIPLSYSLGVAMVPADTDNATTAGRHADKALYLAKSSGGGSIRFFEPILAEQSRSRRAAIVDLRRAVERKEFVLHYQPITRLNGEVTGFEALVRWKHPVRGIVPPADFIPLAEQSGLIGPIGEWVLRQACRDAALWEKPLQIAVNLSPVQFRLGDIAQTVHAVLLETGLPARRLELEMTESAMVENASRTLAVLRRLKTLGVGIAMDDFGTGYSSLGYLQAFPFDRIKLDRAFTARLGCDDLSDAITRAVIGLGHTLSLQILAEGVETEKQRAFLKAEHCDLIQGYLYGRPAPIESFAEWLGVVPQTEPAFSRAG